MMNVNQGKRIIADGRFLRLIDDHGWEYVERKNSHAVVAIIGQTEEQTVVLIEQFRQSMGGMVTELPAGLVGDEEDRDESIFTAAARELFEETGYVARQMERVAAGPSSTGLTNEVITYILATGLEKKGDGGGVANEQITIHEVPLGEVDAWLSQRSAAGCVDPRIYTGLYFLRRSRGECQ
ncbi:MAG TPA: NUDIX hydrolase [Armatimonadota bacterium]|jgi:ADP-ribose pyrophosphatase